MSLATFVLVIAHESWWLAVISCSAFSLAAYLGGLFLYRRRAGRGEVVDFAGGSDSLAIPFAVGFGGTVLSSIALGSFVATLMGLMLAAISGLGLSAVRFSRTEAKRAEVKGPGS